MVCGFWGFFNKKPFSCGNFYFLERCSGYCRDFGGQSFLCAGLWPSSHPAWVNSQHSTFIQHTTAGWEAARISGRHKTARTWMLQGNEGILLQFPRGLWYNFSILLHSGLPCFAHTGTQLELSKKPYKKDDFKKL